MPGATGIRGRLYKLHADTLAPVFMEAFQDLIDGTEEVPPHLHEMLCVVMAKEHGADTISRLRDLELRVAR